jgi:putative tricarboxylic transport membrane protein
MAVTSGQPRSGAVSAAAPGHGQRRGQSRVLGLVVLAAGLVLLREAIAEAEGSGLTIDGPRLWPLVVTLGWVALAAAYLLQQVVVPAWIIRREADEIPGARVRWNWRTPAGLTAALVGYSLAVEHSGAGYVLATAAFFVVAAWLLGSRRVGRDLVVGVTVPIVIYLGFTRLLDIPLPQGVIPL